MTERKPMSDSWYEVTDVIADELMRNAAPKLLKTLEDIDGHLVILMGNIGEAEKRDHRWEGMVAVVKGWRDDIRAAIKEAKGE